MEKVSIKTKDGVNIKGNFIKIPGFKSSIGIFMHMMQATKESYGDLSLKLAQDGLSSLAFDFRGHGESDGGPEGYLNFTDEDHQKYIKDLEAAIEFLITEGFTLANQFFIGASIGANLIIEYAESQSQVKQPLVLLSPGFDYHGVKIREHFAQIDGEKVFIAASKNDGYSYNTVLWLIRTWPKAKALIYREAGHGTNMFEKEEPDLEDEIVSWLKKFLK